MKFFKFLALITFIICCSNCNKECNELHPDELGFGFRLLSKTSGESLIALWGTIYNSEQTILKNEDGTIPNLLNINGSGKIAFLIPDYPIETIGILQIKTYYLILPDPSGIQGREDIDTLKFEFAFKSNDCPEIWYDHFKIFYNDSLYHDDDYIPYIEFYKN